MFPRCNIIEFEAVLPMTFSPHIEPKSCKKVNVVESGQLQRVGNPLFTLCSLWLVGHWPVLTPCGLILISQWPNSIGDATAQQPRGRSGGGIVCPYLRQNPISFSAFSVSGDAPDQIKRREATNEQNIVVCCGSWVACRIIFQRICEGTWRSFLGFAGAAIQDEWPRY